MVFLGASFWADASCADSAAVVPNTMKYIGITDCVADDVYLTKDTDVEEISDDWDINTVLHAEFESDTTAGNMTWYTDSVDCILLRRREYNTTVGNWITIHQQKITDVEDFNFIYKDYLCTAKKTYQYAIVPVYTGNREGTMIYGLNETDNTNYLTVEYNGITVIGKNAAYNTIIELGDTNTTRVQKVGIVELQNYQKPKIFVNSKISYDTGTVSGLFVKHDVDTCSFDFDNAYAYRQEFMDFLSDSTVKFIKSWDGRAWVAAISGEPTDKADGHHDVRITEFTFTEVGSVDSEKDLYRYGLINAEETFWCNYYN